MVKKKEKKIAVEIPGMRCYAWRWHTEGVGFGIFLILLGLLFYARYIGWITYQGPIWPLIVIIIGIWFVVKNIGMRRRWQ